LQDSELKLDQLFHGDELEALLGDLTPRDGAEPPEDFKSYDEEIDTEYCCPKCGYQWSGKPK